MENVHIQKMQYYIVQHVLINTQANYESYLKLGVVFVGEHSDAFTDAKASLMFGNWNEDGMSLTFYCLADGILEEKQVFSSISIYMLTIESFLSSLYETNSYCHLYPVFSDTWLQGHL